MKRALDVVVAICVLIATLPFMLVAMLLVWAQDGHSPFYMASRMRNRRETFRMIKLRSMIINAEKAGGSSTSANDRRITWIGKLLRAYKLDELPQLINVLKGEMSLVGPRPQVQKDVSFYSDEEYKLFDARPGITDFSSIVFSDEGEVLKDSQNPDLRYNQIIRPWKSRLGLFYVANQSCVTDIKIIILTAVAVIDRKRALRGVQSILMSLGADPALVEVAGRQKELVPTPPPGMDAVEQRFNS